MRFHAPHAMPKPYRMQPLLHTFQQHRSHQDRRQEVRPVLQQLKHWHDCLVDHVNQAPEWLVCPAQAKAEGPQLDLGSIKVDSVGQVELILVAEVVAIDGEQGDILTLQTWWRTKISGAAEMRCTPAACRPPAAYALWVQHF
jgi:hypothetical protein